MFSSSANQSVARDSLVDSGNLKMQMDSVLSSSLNSNLAGDFGLSHQEIANFQTVPLQQRASGADLANFSPSSTPSCTTPTGFKTEPTEMLKKHSADSISSSFSDQEKASTPSSKPSRRLTGHKAAEQRSRDKLRNCIDELRVSIPSMSSEKTRLSKSKIIKKATEYIECAKKCVNFLKTENMRMGTEMNALKMDFDNVSQQCVLLQQKAQLSNMTTIEVVDANYNYIHVDNLFELIMGWSNPEIVGQNAKSLTFCEEFVVSQQQISNMDCVTSTELPWNGISVGKRKDGCYFACQMTVMPINIGGQICQYIIKRKNFNLLDHDRAHRVGNNMPTEEDQAFMDRLDMESMQENRFNVI
eukprot:Nk52_evm19s281 gene=Nk52_evmTU19s281